jgi:PEP-CTERM/exosortase A-associated glycosyltransferase
MRVHSGYAFRTLAILREQRALGWDTIQLTSPKQEGNGGELEEVVDGWHFFRTPRPANGFSSIPGFGEVQLMGELTYRIEQVVKRLRPHILHAHSPVLNALPALRVGKRISIPVVYEVRAIWEDAAVDHGTAKEGGLRYRLSRALETFALKHATAVTTICEGLRKDIVARGIPSEKITVIPNAVDVDQFSVGGSPDPVLRRSLGLESTTVLGFIGSFYAYEGLALLLRALPEILVAEPSVRVLLVGGGPDEQNLREMAAGLGLTDKVLFAGRVPHNEISRYYDLVDILVYPRIPIRLTELVTPLKPLEAMAQGRLVIASNVGGHRELIQDGQTGVLFRANDPRDLATKVLRLIASTDVKRQLRVNGRTFVENERTWRASVARYRNVYEQCLGQRL